MEAILCDGSLYGWSLLGIEASPFREQLIEGSSFEAISTQDMITNFCSFFNDTN